MHTLDSVGSLPDCGYLILLDAHDTPSRSRQDNGDEGRGAVGAGVYIAGKREGGNKEHW